jgi:spore germination cell wall hydrolase CwlJ-like protein
MIPAALIAIALAGGSAKADTGEARPVRTGIAGAMNQEHVMLRSASGARISELKGMNRPKARDAGAGKTVTVASRDVDGLGVKPRRSAEATAVTAKKLDLATLDALPPAAGGADWQCLAQAIYFESRGEPLDGQIAVAEVVLNRVDDRNFPGTVCGVTRQGCQFSYTCDGNSDTMKSGVAKARSEKLASLMLAGRPRTLTDGALYFHTRSVRPDWSRRFARTTTIGHHMFYRPATQVAGG